MVVNPSEKTYSALIEYLNTTEQLHTFAFPDQDLLAAFFKGKWHPLPWYYNALKTLKFIHQKEWSDEEVRCLHYILHDKPWHARVPTGSEYDGLHQLWWDQFDAIGKEMENVDRDGWNLLLSQVAN